MNHIAATRFLPQRIVRRGDVEQGRPFGTGSAGNRQKLLHRNIRQQQGGPFGHHFPKGINRIIAFTHRGVDQGELLTEETPGRIVVADGKLCTSQTIIRGRLVKQ